MPRSEPKPMPFHWNHRIFLTVLCALSVATIALGQAQTPPLPVADFVVYAPHVLTVERQTGAVQAGDTPQQLAPQRRIEGVAVIGDRIQAVGTRQQLQPLIGSKTQIIQAPAGSTLMPGLIESHGHFVGIGESLMMLDLRPQTSWQQIVDDVAAAAQKLPAGTWIVGRGWHQSKWTEPLDRDVDGYPVHDSLSQAVPDHPVLLTHASGHACFANLAAMRRARVDADTPNPPGGEILKDSNGDPTGLFRERAAGLIQAAQSRAEQLLTPEQRLEQFTRAVQLASEECQRYGITSFHDAGSSVATVDMLRKLAKEGIIGVRLYVMIRDSNDALQANLARLRTIGEADGFFTVRSIKKSIDGALGPHGAWLLSPYEDLPQSRGLATLPVEEVEQAAQLAALHDYQLCVHAIGDRANREVLDLYSRALTADQLKAARWRIEHAQHLDRADIGRFGQLGVIAAVQGIHCTSDAPFVIQRLGYRRAATGAYMWRSLADSGALICNGTDAPVEPLNPFPSLYATETRTLADGTQFFPEESLTRSEAIATYTINGAIAAFEETQKGSLTAGKLADMIIVDCDLDQCSAETLRDAKVLTTILAGKVVYQSTLP